jgi:hypothetical protein
MCHLRFVGRNALLPVLYSITSPCCLWLKVKHTLIKPELNVQVRAYKTMQTKIISHSPSICNNKHN